MGGGPDSKKKTKELNQEKKETKEKGKGGKKKSLDVRRKEVDTSKYDTEKVKAKKKKRKRKTSKSNSGKSKGTKKNTKTTRREAMASSNKNKAKKVTQRITVKLNEVTEAVKREKLNESSRKLKTEKVEKEGKKAKRAKKDDSQEKDSKLKRRKSFESKDTVDKPDAKEDKAKRYKNKKGPSLFRTGKITKSLKEAKNKKIDLKRKQTQGSDRKNNSLEEDFLPYLVPRGPKRRDISEKEPILAGPHENPSDSDEVRKLEEILSEKYENQTEKVHWEIHDDWSNDTKLQNLSEPDKPSHHRENEELLQHATGENPPTIDDPSKLTKEDEPNVDASPTELKSPQNRTMRHKSLAETYMPLNKLGHEITNYEAMIRQTKIESSIDASTTTSTYPERDQSETAASENWADVHATTASNNQPIKYDEKEPLQRHAANNGADIGGVEKEAPQEIPEIPIISIDSLRPRNDPMWETGG